MASARLPIASPGPQGRRPSSAGFWVLRFFSKIIDQLPVVVFTRAVQFAVDACLGALALYIAFQLRFDGAVPPYWRNIMWGWMMILPISRPIILLALGTYDSIWRYFNLRDVGLLAVTSLPPTVLILVMRYFSAERINFTKLPAAVILMELGVFLALAGAIRAARRSTYEVSRGLGSKRTRALLVGNEQTLPAALRHVTTYSNINVVGLLAPESALRGLTIGGFTVMDEPSALPRLLAANAVDLVLLADASLDCIAATVQTATEFGTDVRLLPSAANIISGDVRVSARPRPEMAFLDRAPALPEAHLAVSEAFHDRVVLITGAGGSIGSEITRQVAHLRVDSIVLLDHDENSIFEINNELLAAQVKVPIIPLVGDIRDRDRVRSIFAQYEPSIVLHAAAYKHVPVMEVNCCEAVLNNVVGTRNLADAAIEYGADRFLMISTDKAVNPSSVMGATKRIAEGLVQARAAAATKTRFACVRFGNVVGSRGSVVPIFLKQIAQGGPITITDENMTRYFMTIPEAVQLVLQASTLASFGDIYMLDMGDPMKITALARKLIEMSGLRPDKDIKIEFVGARPGEKIHEQLWNEDATVGPTTFPRVYKADAGMLPADFTESLARLEQLAYQRSDRHALEQLRAMGIGFTASSQPEKAAVAG